MQNGPRGRWYFTERENTCSPEARSAHANGSPSKAATCSPSKSIVTSGAAGFSNRRTSGRYATRAGGFQRAGASSIAAVESLEVRHVRLPNFQTFKRARERGGGSATGRYSNRAFESGGGSAPGTTEYLAKSRTPARRSMS